MHETLRILSVEDSEDDAQLIALEFRRAAQKARFTRVDNREALLHALGDGEWDIVLTDYSMPGFGGLDALQVIRDNRPDLPVIFVSGTIGEDVAVGAMKAGANDYVMKGQLGRLVPAVRREVLESDVRLARGKAEQQLKSSQAELAAIYEHAPILMTLWDEELRLVRLNQTAAKLLPPREGPLENLGPGDVFGCASAALGRGCGECASHCLCGLRRLLQETLTTGYSHASTELKLLSGNPQAPKEKWVSASTARMHLEGRARVLLCLEDITEKKQMESKYLHAQRLDLIGNMASGIAHDLNNILAPILMVSSLLKGTIESTEDKDMLGILEREARRGAEIVRQLLMFSRGGERTGAPTQVRQLIKEITLIMRETFPRTLNIINDAPDDLWIVHSDSTQLYQVLMNLCVNARDAMPGGGTLSISAQNVRMDETQAARLPRAKAGTYVKISVTDTGTGIPPEILQRIFDPFFTTKEQGKGTGLGLSTVLGIVHKHEGFVHVDTAPGKGSSFMVYLPASEAAKEPVAESSRASVPYGNGELILIVDDEVSLRTALQHTLEAHRYRVISANNGHEGLELCSQNRENLRLVITDLVMPGMDGISMIRTLRERGVDLTVITVSGNPLEDSSAELQSLKVSEMLLKPYEPGVVLEAIQRCLATGARTGTEACAVSPG